MGLKAWPTVPCCLFLLTGLWAPAGAQTRPRAPTWEKEPLTYRGVMWSAEHAKAAEKLQSGPAPFRNCICSWSGTGVGECPPPDKPPAQQRNCSAMLSVGGVIVKEMWTFLEDQLAGVSLSFESSDYGALRDMFVERYGPPTRTEHSAFKTMGGAETTNEELSWDGSIASVRLEHFSGKITEGSGWVMTNALMSAFADSAKKQRKEGAKVF